MDHKIINLLTNFEAILGPFWGQSWLQNRTKNGTTFGTLSAASQGSEKCENGKYTRVVKRLLELEF